MKRIKFLIFVYALWRFIQDVNKNPRVLKFLERHHDDFVDFGAQRIEKIIFGTDTKRSRKRHAS